MAAKKKAAAKKPAAKTEVDTNASACACFLELAHVNTVWVDNSNGEYRIHAPHEKLEDLYTKVTRKEVDLEAYSAALELAADEAAEA